MKIHYNPRGPNSYDVSLPTGQAEVTLIICPEELNIYTDSVVVVEYFYCPGHQTERKREAFIHDTRILTADEARYFANIVAKKVTAELAQPS